MFNTFNKRASIGLLCIFALAPVLYAGEPIGKDRIGKLVAAAWQAPPSSLDVTWYRESVIVPMSIDKIRTNVEAAFRASDKAAANQDGEKRAAEMEAEIRRIEKMQNAPRILRQRIQTAGFLYRMDERFINNVQQPSDNTSWTRTIVNGGDPLAKDYTHFECNHQAHTATLFNDKQNWQEDHISEYAGMPMAARMLLRVWMGKVEDIGGTKTFVPIPSKIVAVHYNIRICGLR